MLFYRTDLTSSVMWPSSHLTNDDDEDDDDDDNVNQIVLYAKTQRNWEVFLIVSNVLSLLPIFITYFYVFGLFSLYTSNI